MFVHCYKCDSVGQATQDGACPVCGCRSASVVASAACVDAGGCETCLDALKEDLARKTPPYTPEAK